jgi:hypothetical protein
MALSCLAAMSCASSKGTDNGGNGGSGANADARKFFIDNVYPSIAPACGKCHVGGERGAPVWLANNADGSYNALDSATGLIAPPNVSPLVQHGLHSGPALTSDQSDLVTKWLTMEVAARGLTGDTGRPTNLRAAFKAFGACMDYGEWKQLGLDQIAQTDTENQGKCLSCHNRGQASLWLSDNAPETFLHFTKFPYVQRLVIGSVNPSGAFDSIQNSRRMIDKGTEAQQSNANSHPRFALSPTLQTNITQFVTDTISNMNANRCQGAQQPDAGLPDGAP